jgi:hypothetical protein
VQKIYALAQMSEDFTVKYVKERTYIPRCTLFRIQAKAFEPGYRPDKHRRILEAYVEDGKRTGRPVKTVTKAIRQRLLAIFRQERNDREKSTEYLAYECGISYRSVHCVLKAASLNCRKPTKKPGLTDEMKAACLKFAQDQKDWTKDY